MNNKNDNMKTILEKAEAYVSQLLSDRLGGDYLFNNLRRTQRVVERGRELTAEMELSEEARECLELALWFHNTGRIEKGDAVAKESCEIASKFLKGEKAGAQTITTVCKLIQMAHSAEEPKSVLEKAICDACSAYLSEKDFRAISELQREENNRTKENTYDIAGWRKKNIQHFRSGHRYYTDHALEQWQKGKDKNLKRLIKGRKKEKRLIKKAKLKAQFKEKSPDRGVQTLYRTTLRNHIKLSDIADTKSNILLSVNAIIISLALSNLIPKLDNPSNDYLIVPTLIFIVFSIVSMILSISATRPNVTSGTFSKADVAKKKVNLLFFGNFHKMKLSDYEEAIQVMLDDKDYIYRSLTKDLYFLGVVLERKYRILRWTYTIFMLGMILSVIAFGVALKYFGPDRIMDVI